MTANNGAQLPRFTGQHKLDETGTCWENEQLSK